MDYAIMKEGKPIMLIECKWCGADIDKEHASQLYRYFSVTDARIGLLTNGIIYRFYTDLEESNKMDTKPFMEFNMLDIKDTLVEALKRFSKDSFDIEEMLTAASDLKYTKEVKRILAEQMSDPSDDFVKFFGKQVYSGMMTQSVRQQFADIIKRAMHQFINDEINVRLKSALAEGEKERAGEEVEQEDAGDRKRDDGIITTEEEWAAFYIVKAILAETIDINRVTIKDTKSYCNVLLDNKVMKLICRFHFDYSTKLGYLGLFDESKKEEKISIDGINAIYKYADRLKSIVKFYDSVSPPKVTKESEVSAKENKNQS